MSTAHLRKRSVGTRVRQTLERKPLAWLMAVFVVAILAGRASCAELNLSGTWAGIKVLADSATYPLVGTLARTTTLIQRLTIAQTGNVFSVAGTYCAASFDNGPALTTTVDEAFVRSLGTATSGVLDRSDCPVRFVQSWGTELHGVRLDDPENDPLPTSADDPRVFDQDGDGKPGITVHARALGAITGDVYLIERLRTRLEGRVLSPDRIEGDVTGTVEQIILGATNLLFLGEIVSHPDPIPANSTFVLQLIDPAWTCEQILGSRATLFGR